MGEGRMSKMTDWGGGEEWEEKEKRGREKIEG